MLQTSRKFTSACLVLMLSVAVFLSSCVKEPDLVCPTDPDVMSESGMTTLRINVPGAALPSTRSIDEGGSADNRVDNLLFLFFNKSDGLFADYALSSEVVTPDPAYPNTKTVTVLLPDGEYNSLILANADALFRDSEDKFVFDTNADDYAALTMSDIEKGSNALVTDIAGKWNANPAASAFRPFPMSSHLDIPQDHSLLAGKTINLTRMLAKVNVKMSITYPAKVTDDQLFKLNAIRLVNYNGRASVAQPVPTAALSVFDAASLNLPTAPQFQAGMDKALVYLPTANPAEITTVADDFGNALYQSVDNIFLPEAAAPANEKDPSATCLMLEIFVPATQTYRWFRVNFRMEDPDDANIVKPINILRNFRYTINITGIAGLGFATPEEAYEAPAEGITTIIDASDESDMNDITFDGRYQLTTNKSTFIFGSDGGTQELKIFTDYMNDGWQVANSTGGFFTNPVTAGLGGVITTTALGCGPNNGTTMLRGTIVLTAGTLRKTITVIQLPPTGNITDTPAPAGFTPYVGAFWKANQTGERLIRMAAADDVLPSVDGKWTAVVVEGQDWIQLDTLMTNDPNVGWLGGNEAAVDNGNDAGFDTRHQIIGNNDMVEGTMDDTNKQIYFRIGLNGHHAVTKDKPARYGLILLTYNDNAAQQRIWVRQGEEADYLMRNATDPINIGGVTTRTKSVPFSPYNLTAATLNAPVSINGRTDTSEQPGIFTDYPTQAGALFQWAATDAVLRKAWPAIGPVPDWNATSVAGTWNALYETNETCPEGYRRPEDISSTDATIAASELRQSLIMNFNSVTTGKGDNSTWGYYADGWFDRRQTGDSEIGIANSAVAAGDPAGVAYIGQVLFNPNTNASLFMPATGNREQTKGALQEPGNAGIYFPGYATQIRFAVRINDTPHTGNAGTGGNAQAGAIRCVKAAPLPPASPLAPPGVIGYTAITHQLTLRGSAEYADNPDIAAAAEAMFPGQGLHEERVYVAYYKWGSLVATGGDDGSSLFSANDIIWAPDEYSYGGFTGTDAAKNRVGTGLGAGPWNAIPFKSDTSLGLEPTNPATLTGDPCTLMTEGGGGWMMPVDESASATLVGWNSGSFGTTTRGTAIPWASVTNGAHWVAKDAVNKLPESGAVGGDGTSADWSMFLPAAGLRHTSDYKVQYIGLNGHYWSSSMGTTATQVSKLDISAAQVIPYGTSNAPLGMTVRCVKTPVQPLPDLVQAAPGVVGIKHSDLTALRNGETTPGVGYSLTVRGSNKYEGSAATTAEFGPPEDEPVYVVNFKWGSLVGMVFKAGDTYSADNVVWVNPGFTGAITDDYNSFSPATPTGTAGEGYNIPSVPTNGTGDICSTIPCGTWHIPTTTEDMAYTTGATTAPDTDTSTPNKSWLSKNGENMLTAAGMYAAPGPISEYGVWGFYWSSSTNRNYISFAAYYSVGANRGNGDTSWALSVRCATGAPL